MERRTTNGLLIWPNISAARTNNIDDLNIPPPTHKSTPGLPPRCQSLSLIRRRTMSLRKSCPATQPALFFEPHPTSTPAPASATQPPAMDMPSSNHPVTSTPQNTPANAAPISSHAQKPGVGTIKEGKSLCFPFCCWACPSTQSPACSIARGPTANSNFLLQTTSSAPPPTSSLPTPPSSP